MILYIICAQLENWFSYGGIMDWIDIVAKFMTFAIPDGNSTRTLFALRALRYAINLHFCTRVTSLTCNCHTRRVMDGAILINVTGFRKPVKRLWSALAIATVPAHVSQPRLGRKAALVSGTKSPGLKNEHASCLFFLQKRPISCNLLARAGRGQTTGILWLATATCVINRNLRATLILSRSLVSASLFSKLNK